MSGAELDANSSLIYLIHFLIDRFRSLCIEAIIFPFHDSAELNPLKSRKVRQTLLSIELLSQLKTDSLH